MFCPKCKYEYRPGFKICSDCNVELVDSLPAIDSNNKRNIFKIRTRTKYFIFNCLWGIFGGSSIYIGLMVAITHSQPLPYEMRNQVRHSSNTLPFLSLCYFLILFVIDLIGLIKHLKWNFSTGQTILSTIKISILNILLFVISFVGSLIFISKIII